MAFLKPVRNGESVKLSSIPTDEDAGVSRDDQKEILESLGAEFEELTELLFAAGSNGLLIVMQGRDTAGKGGAIKRILEHSNVQSTHVQPFKVPTPLELAHDFLWRVHAHTPGKGGITIFDRSHYEDVLVVRVHQYVPEPVWKDRYDHINAFEKLLVDSGTIIVKFMLHISKGEQEQRLLDREKEVEKSWKLNVGDWKEREYWDDYTTAYEDALTKCSFDHAPWYVVPADKKWFRDVAVMETLVDTLRPYKEKWLDELAKIGEAAKAELEAMRSGS